MKTRPDVSEVVRGITHSSHGTHVSSPQTSMCDLKRH